jgi:hypothetical protein
MTAPCSEDEHDYHWYPAVNEEGWRCCVCEHKPGEPPGFDPGRDRADIGRKVWAILHDLDAAKIVHVSNATAGDAITHGVAQRCRATSRYDQSSIALYILEGLAPSHADYWHAISVGVLDGKDTRPRCWCGALSTCSSSSGGGPWVHRCNVHVGTEDPQLGLALGEEPP